jgi:alkylation response protein AidB-like acyl-CoA dehydrogenase
MSHNGAQLAPTGQLTSTGQAGSAERVTVADLNERAVRVIAELGPGAADRERRRIMPFEQIRRLAGERLFTFRIPAAYGGPGSTLAELFQFLVDLSAADSNIAQSLRPGYLTVESLLWSGDEADQRLWFPRIMAGDVIGNAGWERGGANGEIQTRITRAETAFRVNGTKSYSTGALFADWVSATAVDEDGNVVHFTVPRDREGLRLLDDWDGAGQRLTASGTTELQDLLVYPDEIRQQVSRGSRSPVVAVAQLFLAAVLAGIARNALTDAVAFATTRARPIVHSAAKKSSDDLYVQHVVGEISARAFAAEAVVIRAAASIDRALAVGVPAEAGAFAGSPAEKALTEAAIDVARAQFFAAEAALRNGELIFDVGGASATLREHNLDRHWRNARTVANHNPRDYKAGVVGAYHLNGAEPPTSGLF